MSSRPALPAGFPGVIWRRVETVLAEFIADPASTPVGARRSAPTEDPAEVAEEVAHWLDGRSADDLEGVLDALREVGAYPVSLPLLEQAWNAELPLDRLGRVAEDWLGTVLHGLADRDGALVVGHHLRTRALELGAAFAGDLGHLLIDLELFEAADPLVRFAAEHQPGDTALAYALGVVCKFAGDFAGCRAAFEAVLATRPTETAAWYNLGIACTALRDWAGARKAWSQVGFSLPEGEGDFAAAGDACAVRLPVPAPEHLGPDARRRVRHEVVAGVRLCPARVRLLAVPAFAHGFANYGDVVLIDGNTVGESRGANGETLPVLPALHRLTVYGGTRLLWRAPVEDAQSRRRLSTAARALAEAGWPVADLTGQLTDAHTLCLALHLPPDRAAEAGIAAIGRYAAGLGLTCPEAEALAAAEQADDPPPPALEPNERRPGAPPSEDDAAP
jgi:hypothetical protein